MRQASGDAASVEPHFGKGSTWGQLLAVVSAQQELWLKTESAVDVPGKPRRARKEGERLAMPKEVLGPFCRSMRGKHGGLAGLVERKDVVRLRFHVRDFHTR